ncbi:Calx-beta domain-containing protein [Actinokineospora inagensis]|uniref:Calx-beta domain-containing protein n=1 Tax=Actinokineospora inagensis TaxID=103730 RepID=UPI001FDF9020|nr:Calx-beta domain-containing protein [Actinokineospora inagensis]
MRSVGKSLRKPLRYPVVLAVVTALVAAGVTPAHAGVPGVVPSTVDVVLAPGGSTTVTKTVTTSTLPSTPDIVFLADTTGSMTSAIANVRSNIGSLTGSVLTEAPTARFAVAEYKDMTDDVPFQVDQSLTADVTAVQAGTALWSAGGGGDFPEDELNALYRIATGDIAFRATSSRVVVMFGDAPSHDPSNGHTLADTTAALQAAKIRVVAVNSSGLDARGQATALVNATGGVLLNGVSSTAVPQAILDGLHNIKVAVTPSVTSCPTGVSVSNTPATTSVASGKAATFTETVSVAANTAPGTYTCVVDYLVDGASQGYTQTTTIRVLGLSINDVTVLEPGTGTSVATFTVTLAGSTTTPVTVNYATVAGTAIAGADFTPATGTLTFAPGDTTKTIAVPILPDLVDEPTETFQVVLSNAVGAIIGKGTGTGTIQDVTRDGTYTCQATAAKILLLAAAVANAQDAPCVEESPSLLNASLPASGILNVITGDVGSQTVLTPHNQASVPAAADGVLSSTTVSSTTISLLGIANIQVGAVTASAGYTCTAQPDGSLSPVFSATSNVASLKVNGLAVTVGSGTLTIPLVAGTLRINATTQVNGEYVRQAFALDTVVGTVILGEAKAGIKGTTLHPTGNPCQA